MTKKRRLLCLAVSLLLAAAALLLTYRLAEGQERKAYDMVLLGDSIMGKERYYRTTDGLLEEMTGLTVYNGAFSGTSASAGNPDNRSSFHEDAFNLCRLTDAICSGDFGVQMAELNENQYASWYFGEALEGLAQVDFAAVDTVLIEHGMNDYTNIRDLDDPDNPYNTRTYGGALRYSIEMLQNHFPQMRILLVSPCYSWIDGSGTNDMADFGKGTAWAYRAKILEIAQEYGLDSIDVYTEIGFNADNIREYTEDGIHLNDEGRLLYGEFLAKKLIELSIGSAQ